MWPFPDAGDIAESMLDTVVGWLAKAILAALKALWGLLAQTAFTSPDVTVLPQVATVSGRSQLVVNTAFVLAIIAVAVTVMTRETVQVRYGIGDLVPRMVVGFIAANFATPICSQLIQTANALTGALTGDSIAAAGSFDQMRRVVTGAPTNQSNSFLLVVVGLIIAVLTGVLLVYWLVRTGVLIMLVGIAPVALACHSTPFTEGAARLWWRSLLGVLATVALQAFAMHTALSIFLDPNANVAALGIPRDPTGTLNLFIVACLLWVTVKIPGLVRRYVMRGGQNSSAGLVVRMLLIQQVSRLVRLPLGGRGRVTAARAGAASGGARRAAAAGVAAGGPSVAATAIPYWRPPRPTPAAARLVPPTAAAKSTTAAPAGSPGRAAGQPAGGGATTAPAAAGASSSPPLRSPIPAGTTPATVMPLRRPGWRAYSARPSGTGWPDPPPSRSGSRGGGRPLAPASARPSGTGWPSTRIRPGGDPRYPVTKQPRRGGPSGR
jgi:hypothetical protein